MCPVLAAAQTGEHADSMKFHNRKRPRGGPVRVLHVYKTYFPDTWGGLEQAILQICRSTAALGAENTIFTLSHDPSAGHIERAEADVYRYPISADFASCPVSARAFLAFRRHVAKTDVVHYHFPWPFADILDMLRPRHIPAVITYHSDIVRQRALLRFYRPLMRYFLGAAEKVVATSANYLRSSEELQRLKCRVEVIPFGLDEASYPGADPARLDHWRAVYGDRFFLFIGVLRYYKGLHILLNAARGAGYKILIIGAGPTERELKGLAAELALDNVEFLGFLPETDKVALLKLCRGVVFPSHLRSEAFGISLLEAAMFGKPMVSSEIGTGTSFVNIDGVTGIVAPPNDPASLREAMDRIQADDVLAEDMGRAARLRYERLFTAEKMGRRYLELYKGLLGWAPKDLTETWPGTIG